MGDSKKTEAVAAAKAKVAKIKAVSIAKSVEKQQRRENALKAQEALNTFLKEEKETKKDNRPISYGPDKKVNQSAQQPGSRSISPIARGSGSGKSANNTDLISVRKL